MKHFCAALILLGLSWSFASAQPVLPAPPPDAPVQSARTELPLETGSSEVHPLALAADSAVVLVVGRDRRNSNKSDFFVQHYGADLHLRREVPLAVPDEFRYERMCAEPGVVYALFRSRSVPGRFWALAYDVRGSQVRTQQFDTRLARDLIELKPLDGHLLATVMLADNVHYTALLLDLPTGRAQFLPAVYETVPSELTSVTDAASRRAEFVLSQTNGRKQRLQLKQVSTEYGQLLRSAVVQTESERNLITAQLSPPQDTSARLLAGTYGLRDTRYAQGLFATDLLAAQPLSAAGGGAVKPALRFYDFRRFKHFFDYLRPARQARLRERSDRREARAATPVRWHYRLLLHALRPAPDSAGSGYVLVGEVYYPHYRYNSYGGMPYGGVGTFGPPGLAPYGYGLNSRVFDGYRTTHTLVCGFDKRGNLLWDNVFVMKNELLRYELEEAVRVMPLPGGRFVLAYLDENDLHYKIIRRGEPGPDDRQVPLLTAPAGTVEKVTDTVQADLLPWFGGRYVACGYQHIRGQHRPERQVYFLNTVAF